MGDFEYLESYGAWWLHPTFREHYSGLLKLVAAMELTDGRIPLPGELDGETEGAARWLDNLPRRANGMAIELPLFSTEFCDRMLDFIASEVDNFEVNGEEQSQYQMPELVLEYTHPALYKELLEFAHLTLYKAGYMLFGREVQSCSSIQLARYTPHGIASSDWHHDTDSDFTAVVNLAPELYVGGGTGFRTGVYTEAYVPPPPKGHALLFNGRYALHRGCPVKRGERNILVFWSDTMVYNTEECSECSDES